ncbi:MAG: hypothetical protein ABSF32_11795 [Ignavibacteria bacterium]
MLLVQGSGSDLRGYYNVSWIELYTGIFRDYYLKPWQFITIVSVLLIFGLAFCLWGIKTILDISYITSSGVTTSLVK